MYTRPNFKIEFTRFLQQPSILNRLILINILVWLILSAILVITFLFKIDDEQVKSTLAGFLAIPASFPALLQKPWTLITYMFFHFSFWHILFNLLWLYWFGKIFLEFLSGKQLLVTYFLGGITGGLFFMAAYNIFPVFQEALPEALALGASAAVMAIVTAISFYSPNYHINLLFIGPVRIYYIAIVLFILDFFMIRSENAGGHLAHIGGALYGVLYAYLLRSGIDIARLFQKLKFNIFRRKEKPRVVHGIRNSKGRPMTDDEYNHQRAAHTKRIDAILDKISKSGYESLTKEEKDYLFKESGR